jgi:hypothetical protein
MLEKIKGIYYARIDNVRVVCGVEVKGATVVGGDATTNKAPGDF